MRSGFFFELLARPADWGNWPAPESDASGPEVEREPSDQPDPRCGAER